MRVRRAIAFLLCVFLSCGVATAGSDAGDQAKVTVVTVRSEDLVDVMTYPARVTPRNNTTLLAEIDGVVSELRARIGQKVRAGETLASLLHTDPTYHYAPMRVVSTIHGVVSAVDVSQGDQVSKGQKLISVTDPKRLRVLIEAPASDLGSLHAGMKAELVVLGGESAAIPLVLKGVSPFVDPATGTATAELDVGEPRRELVPGLVGRIRVPIASHRGIRVPDTAIVYRKGQTFVRVLEKDKVRYALVQLGRAQEGKIEILSGLAENELLITRVSHFVADGEIVIRE